MLVLRFFPVSFLLPGASAGAGAASKNEAARSATAATSAPTGATVDSGSSRRAQCPKKSAEENE